MFSLSDFKQTRVYQEALEEGYQEGLEEVQQKCVPRLLKFGLTAEQIAEGLDLILEKVNSVINNL